MNDFEHYVYKKEVDYSLLREGLTLPIDNQVIFGRIMNRYLSRGESKPINIYLNGKSYRAKIYNLNLDEKHHRKADMLQIRYPANGELAQALQGVFSSSFQFIMNERQLRETNSRRRIILPDDMKEYLAIYTTEDDDSYIFEAIQSEDLQALQHVVAGKSERALETELDFDLEDESSSIIEQPGIRKIRKLNRKIGDNLKRLYSYHCQICGQVVGEEFGSHVAEAHHIDYFVHSLNNDASNQIILCPNHHSLIHDADPVFNRKKLVYSYENGMEQKIQLNYHL